MKQSCPEIPESNHDNYEATRDSKESYSQTEDMHNQPMCDEPQPPEPSKKIFNRLTKMFFPQAVKQTPCSSDGRDIHFRRLRQMFPRQRIRETFRKSDGDDFPYLTSKLSSSTLRLPSEGNDASHPDKSVQPGSEMDQTQDHEPGSADQPSVVEFDGPGRRNVNDFDFDFDFDLPVVTEHTDFDNSSKWCSICRDVEKWMIQCEGKRFFNLGTWEDLQKREGCPSCDTMLKIPSMSRPLDPHEKLFFCRDEPLEDASSSYRLRLWNNCFIHLNPLDRGLKQGFIGRVVDPEWFDIARLQRWLTFCDENHGEACHGLPIRHESVSTRPRYLIDVKRGCLIEPRGNERYFALSYVWGTQQNSGMATKSNIERLKLEGAITVRNKSFTLPKTVENAIELTGLLGERFLWIDRLCIIQDDLVNWHSQIKKMGSIYGNAYCTLVASGGEDADHGISGLNQYSGPRKLSRSCITFPSLQMIEVRPSIPVMESTWIHRGWTFQELKLSRRALFFNSDVQWICHQSKWQEDTEVGPDKVYSSMLTRRLDRIKLLDVEPWPDFAQWVSLIREYPYRELRFEDDAGAAFAGIEEVLSYTFPGGFCYGMPEFYFDIALLWRPLLPLQRRISESDTCCLPSWSFLGWKSGLIAGPDFAYDWLAFLPPNNFPLCSTSSIAPKVNWVQKGPRGKERRIRNDHYLWKRSQNQRSPKAHARLGWKMERDGNEWTHASIPKVRFRYPVPLGFQSVNNEYRTWPASLRLRSQSTFLTISNVMEKFDYGTCFSTELVTHTGQWAGMLYMNTDKVKNVPVGAKCELVALSYGSVSNDDEFAGNWMEEWRVKGRPRTTATYEFYNVMWIRREDTYVVRENVGRVEKTVWDSQDLQEVDVELR